MASLNRKHIFSIEWRNVIRLAAIDCAHEENTPVCRDYDIMAYPTLKFFSAQSPPGNLGSELIRTSRTEKNITGELVRILQKEQSEGRGVHWPNILPYRSHDIKNLKKEYESHEEVQYLFLLFVDGVEDIPPQVILDLSNIKGVEIRFASSENEVLARLLGVHSYPSLVLVDPSKSEPEYLRLEEETRESFRRTIKSYLEAKGVTVPDEPRTVRILAGNEEPNMMDLIEAQENEKFLRKIKEMGDVVFLADLESTLRYSLEQEVAARRVIVGDALVALNNYLSVLAKYFPIGEAGISFLQNLKDKVFQLKEITGVKLENLLRNLSGTSLDSVLSTKEEWLGCRGSEPYFRGFPCGLWTMFHYMTVSALRDSEHVHFDPFEVLEAMVGYVTYFFGCTQCSQHFRQMANRSMKAKVTNAQQAVLWLWSAHNEVNQRLSNDPTEDPRFPKIQFPSPERCPKCRDSNNRWDESNILKYLTSVYHQDNLNYLGSNTKLYSPDESDLLGKGAVKSETAHHLSPKKQSKDFNIFDISLCVTLYVVSALICVAVCLKFILRRRLRKKTYVHDVLGRV